MNLKYYSEGNNFGDMLSPLIVKTIVQKGIVENANAPGLLAVGSIIESFGQTGDTIWGTGLMDAKIDPRKRFDIRAVRGPLTRQVLLANGFDCPAIFGDPALLMPSFYWPYSNPKGVSVMPHLSDYNLRKEAIDKNYNLINVRKDPFQIIRQIINSEVLVTSSLHGLIIGESYGIRTVLLRNSEHLGRQGVFKYLDYFQSTGRDFQGEVDVKIEKAVEKACEPPKKLIDLEPLMKAFPQVD